MNHILNFKLILFLILIVGVSCNKQGTVEEEPIIIEVPIIVEADTTKLKTPTKNVVFIIADDLTKTLSTYDHPKVKTPNIDRLAEMGIQFNNAYSNYAVCNPSRSSFLTGMKPQTTTIVSNTTHLQDVIGDWVTLPALFKKNGYYTVSLGKIFHTNKPEDNDLKAWDQIYSFKNTDKGNLGEGRDLTNGATTWCRWLAADGEDEDQMDGQIAKKAVKFLKTKREGPFFLAVGLKKPHDPYIAPKKYFDMYPLEECDPPMLPDNWESPPYAISNSSKELFLKFTEQDKREFLRAYYACSSFIDAQVEKLLDALKEADLMDNTVIVFLGDHGYHLGQHNHWNKVTLFEQGTSAPFIIVDPSATVKGVKTNSMIEFIDIYPTMAELCELNYTPKNLEGQSFYQVLNNPTMPFRNEVHAIIKRGSVLGKSVKTKEWRYVEWENGTKGVELYDQINDPMEYVNLAKNSDKSAIISDLKSRLY